MPWAVLLPLTSLLPFMLSGAVRYELGTSFEVSLALPGALFVIVAGALYTYGLPALEQAHNRWASPAVAVFALLAIAITFELWWTPLFGGLPNTFEGVDLGNHLLLYQRFIRPGRHRQYMGFVSMYALMHWYRALFAAKQSEAQSYYYALRFTHYAFLLSVPVALALMVYPSLARIRGTTQLLISAVLSLPVQLAALGFLLFPVLQYYQAEGFYSQIAGLYPLLFCFLSYGFIENAGARFVLCCFWIVVQRFTYGLNIGDALIALAYIMLFDARDIRSRLLRWGAYAFVPVALYGAYGILRKLWFLRVSKGYFINYSIGWIIASLILTGVLLTMAPAFFRERGITVSATSERIWRFAGIHGLASGILMALYVAANAPIYYYVQKFALYPTVLQGLAIVGPVCTLIAHLVEHGPQWALANARFLWNSSALGTLALFAVLQGYVVYRRLANERWRHTAPSAALYSNYEPEIQAFIEKTTKEHKAGFGGYYDAFWPRMFTHNTLYYLFEHRPDFFFNMDFLLGNTMFLELKNYCYFVQGKPSEYLPSPTTEMKRQVQRFYNERDVCMTYQPAWSERSLTVCAACF
jgi:hypothetical protein